jgi:hypothetical protein
MAPASLLKTFFLESLNFFHGEKVKAFNRTTMALVYCLLLGGSLSENLFGSALIGGGLEIATPTS